MIVDLGFDRVGDDPRHVDIPPCTLYSPPTEYTLINLARKPSSRITGNFAATAATAATSRWRGGRLRDVTEEQVERVIARTRIAILRPWDEAPSGSARSFAYRVRMHILVKEIVEKRLWVRGMRPGLSDAAQKPAASSRAVVPVGGVVPVRVCADSVDYGLSLFGRRLDRDTCEVRSEIIGGVNILKSKAIGSRNGYAEECLPLTRRRVVWPKTSYGRVASVLVVC